MDNLKPYTARGSGQSLADHVFEKLQTDIIDGLRAPGSALTELKICAELGVSRTPVREALVMLEQQGLIEMKPNRSAVVVGITKQDVEDIYNIRTHIEGLAAARAAENRSEEQLRSLQELCDLQSFYREKGSAVRMNELDSHFHEELYKCCQSRQLELFLQDLHRKISRFRRLSINSEERAGKMLAEHEAILDAIREQNSRLAEELMIKHITNAKDNLLKLLSEQEDKENG